MAVIDVTSFFDEDAPETLQSLIDVLVMEIGPQHDVGQSLFQYSGDGWSVFVQLAKESHSWFVNIDDDTLAVAFKLKWL